MDEPSTGEAVGRVAEPPRGNARPLGTESAQARDEAPAPTRGFLFADLRGYTGYVEAHGDEAGAVLLERYRLLVRGVVAEARGAEVKTEGDSFYVVFGSVSGAVRAGLAIVDAAAGSADPDPIRVGVGVHAGETVETADGFVGSAVNIAARLCAEAHAGELVVSETVRGLVRTRLDVDFVPLGARHLKGLAEPVACYRVVPRGDARPAAGTGKRDRRRRLVAAIAATVVVLAVVAAAAATFVGGQTVTPTLSPGPAAAVLASPSAVSASPGMSSGGPASAPAPSASPTLGPFPNPVEAAILAALPSTLASTCVRGGTPDDARLAGFTGILTVTHSGGHWPQSVTPDGSRGGVTCHPRTGAARVYVMDLGKPTTGAGEWSTADATLGYLEARYRLPLGSCENQHGAHELWSGPSGSGTLACMNPYDGRPWIYFTFGKGQYLAFATRDDSDYASLYAWWEQLKTFLP